MASCMMCCKQKQVGTGHCWALWIKSPSCISDSFAGFHLLAYSDTLPGTGFRRSSDPVICTNVVSFLLNNSYLQIYFKPFSLTSPDASTVLRVSGFIIAEKWSTALMACFHGEEKKQKHLQLCPADRHTWIPTLASAACTRRWRHLLSCKVCDHLGLQLGRTGTELHNKSLQSDDDRSVW